MVSVQTTSINYLQKQTDFILSVLHDCNVFTKSCHSTQAQSTFYCSYHITVFAGKFTTYTQLCKGNNSGNFLNKVIKSKKNTAPS